MADLLDPMAAGMRDGSVAEHIDDWLRRGRALGGEIERVDDALREAEDSIRLNRRGVRLLGAPVRLRARLETLEHAAITVRIFARALADSIRLPRATTRCRIPRSATGSPGRWRSSPWPSGSTAGSPPPRDHPRRNISLPSWSATWPRPRISRTGSASCSDPTRRPGGELRAADETTSPRPRRFRSWRRPLQAGRRQRRSPTRQRPPA
jgi:hypothetical protein